MNRPLSRSSGKLEALLDERDDLHIRISLQADEPNSDAGKLDAMSRRLQQIEHEIIAERKRLFPEL